MIGMPQGGLWIAHVPIRSVKQAHQKALLSWPGERDNPDRQPDQGFHWKDLYDRASAVDSFNHADIIELAATYGCTRHDVCSALVRDSFTKYVSLS
jgi:hypothetical protein